jgi:hypothetical protein
MANDSFWISMGPGQHAPMVPIRNVNANYSETDWYRIKLDVDLAANGGNGSGSVSVSNLTMGQTNFYNVIGLQRINLRLLDEPLVASPSTWNAAGIRVYNHAFFENTGALIDNIGMTVPEPTLGAGACALVLMRRRMR